MKALIESSIQHGDERFGIVDASDDEKNGTRTLKKLQKRKKVARSNHSLKVAKKSKSEKMLSKALFSPNRSAKAGGIKLKGKRKKIKNNGTKSKEKAGTTMRKSKSTPHVGVVSREDLDCIGSAPTLEAAINLPNVDLQVEDLLAGEANLEDAKVLTPHVTVERGKAKRKHEKVNSRASASAQLSHAQDDLIQSLARDIVLSKEKEWARGRELMPPSPGSMIHSLPSSLSPAVRRG